MSHIALEIENWKLANLSEPLELSKRTFDNYSELQIDAKSFYAFLKNRFGLPNQEKNVLLEMAFDKSTLGYKRWYYLFKSGDYLISVRGNDDINITVLSLKEPPNETDFVLFANSCNAKLKDVVLEDNNQYNLYANYHFFLKKQITDLKKSIKNENLTPYEMPLLNGSEDFNNPEVKYKFNEAARDFNQWKKAVIERSQITLNILILLPIYLESLYELAFRIKLCKSGYVKEFPNAYFPELKLNIFQYFEKQSVKKKLELIKSECFDVNVRKVDNFYRKLKEYEIREDRNKLLHGSISYFENLQYQFYGDDNYIVGFPDKAKAMKLIVETIQKTIADKKIIREIEKFENLCSRFKDIFEDNDYFKKLVDGIVFGYNKAGGALSLPFNLDNLIIPEDLV